MFFKPFEITLNRVHDKVKITNGETSILLTVDADPGKLVSGLLRARQEMSELNVDSEPEKMLDAARNVAQVIFGEAQAEKLMAFYPDETAMCVFDVCQRYFSGRLGKLIEKAQKK